MLSIPWGATRDLNILCVIMSDFVQEFPFSLCIYLSFSSGQEKIIVFALGF